MKLENQDLIDQLETEKMMAVNSLRRVVCVLEAMALDGVIPRGYAKMTSEGLDMSWTALAWITAWDREQAA